MDIDIWHTFENQHNIAYPLTGKAIGKLRYPEPILNYIWNSGRHESSNIIGQCMSHETIVTNIEYKQYYDST